MNYLLVAFALLLVGCSPKDKFYYQTHPQYLQNAIKDCQLKASTSLSCEQLKEVALASNALAYQLQMNPQAFGQQILNLEEKIALQKKELNTKADQPKLKTGLEKNERLLKQYLAIVQWLESPES